ncbi:MAG: conjugal transfer protein TraF [Elusimicrobiales bacterium]|jgi:hypothetical protein
MKRSCLLPALGLVFVVSPSRAGFQDTPVSVKAEAMGGAFVAMSGDAGAAWINPAGLASLRYSEFAMMYGKPLAGLEGIDLNQGYLAFGTRLSKRWAAAMNTSIYQAAGLFSEYQAGFSGSFRINPKLAVGAGVSYLYHKYDIAGDPAYSSLPVFADGSSRGAAGINLGVIAFLNREFQIGASVRNLNRPDVGLQEYDPVAREIRIGGMYRMLYARVQAELEESDDGLGTRYSRTDTWKLGVEIPVNSMSFRAGVNSNAFTAGLGVTSGDFVVDYAFVVSRAVEATNYGSQFLALSYRIGAGDAAARRSRTSGKRTDRQDREKSSAWVW